MEFHSDIGLVEIGKLQADSINKISYRGKDEYEEMPALISRRCGSPVV